MQEKQVYRTNLNGRREHDSLFVCQQRSRTRLASLSISITTRTRHLSLRSPAPHRRLGKTSVSTREPIRDTARSSGLDPREGSQGRRPALHGLPRPVAALHHPGRGARRSTSSRKASASTAPAIRGWQAINESDMLVVPQPDTAFLDPFCQRHDADDDLQHPGPAHQGGLHPRPAQRRPQGRQLHEVAPASPTPPTSARELEFFIFDDVRYDQTHALGVLLRRQRRGRLEHRPRREAEPRLQDPLQGGLLPRARRPTRCTTCAPR